MKLNGIECADYGESRNLVTFLLRCPLTDALDLDGEVLEVTGDSGEKVAVFGGYTLLGVSKGADGCTEAKFSRELSHDDNQLIREALGNIEVVRDNLKRVRSELNADIATVRSTANGNSGLLEELTSLVEATASAVEDMALQMFE